MLLYYIYICIVYNCIVTIYIVTLKLYNYIYNNCITDYTKYNYIYITIKLYHTYNLQCIQELISSNPILLGFNPPLSPFQSTTIHHPSPSPESCSKLGITL